MKALSLTPFWALMVMLREKTIEVRTWQTDYRGDILICASSRRESGCISGKALCVVELTDIEPLKEEHLDAALMEEMPDRKSYAWHLENLQWVEPFDVKGALHLYEVPDEKVEYIEFETDEDYFRILREKFLPLVDFARGDKNAHELWDWILMQ